MLRLLMVFGAGIALVAMPATFSHAACSLPAQGDGVVTAVPDQRTLRLSDGRDIKLTGIEFLTGSAAATVAVQTLRTRTEGRTVSLRAEDDTPDRYGRQGALVYVDAQTASLQSDLLAQGLAVRSLDDLAIKGCAADLIAAEQDARAGRRGVWGEATTIKNAEDSETLLQNVGRFTVLEGTIVSARQAGSTLYLNFSRRWIQGFAATVSRRMMPAFATAGLTAASLNNRRVRLRGWVERRGGPRIDLVQPAQIEFIGDAPAAVTAKQE